MKKIISIVASVMLCICIASCGSTEDSRKSSMKTDDNKTSIQKAQSIMNESNDDSVDNSLLNVLVPDDLQDALNALDRYFDAVNRLDKYAVFEACYPDLSLVDEDIIPKSDGVFFIKRLGFEDSFMSNMAIVNHDAEELQARSYGFGSYKEFFEARKNDDIERMLPDFEASYEIDKIDNATNLVIYDVEQGAGGGWTREEPELEQIDLAEYISEKLDINVDEVYVVQIKYSWQCGDMLYGNDPDWWNNAAFLNWINEDLGSVEKERYQTYDSVIKMYENKSHSDTVIYKCNGEWYVFRNHYYNGFEIEW